MGKSVALIELGDSHDECLYSQVKFFNKSNFNVHLIVTDKLRERVSTLPVYETLITKKSIQGYLILKKHLKRKGISNIVINTCSGNDVRLLVLLLGHRFNITGILHNGSKLSKSLSQKVISLRVKKYFVLNDYIKRNLNPPKGIKVQTTYPIFFPETKTKSVKVDDDLWICIPGSLDLERRDYEGLIETLTPKNLKGVKILLLGRTNQESEGFLYIQSILQEKKISDHFLFFDRYVSEPDFYSYIMNSDLMMPLIHPSKEKYSIYKRFKIAGSFNLAFGFRKPLLLENSWREVEDFQSTSIFYDLNKIGDVIESLKLEREKINTLEAAYNKVEKFDLDYQSRNYQNFILS